MGKEVIIIKVAGSSNVKAVAGSISMALKGTATTPPKVVEIHTVGASACNQAVKALAISSGHMAMAGMTLKSRFGFNVIKINDQERTAIKFIVEVE